MVVFMLAGCGGGASRPETTGLKGLDLSSAGFGAGESRTALMGAGEPSGAIAQPPFPEAALFRDQPGDQGFGAAEDKLERMSREKPLVARGGLDYRDYFVLAPYLEGITSWYGPQFHGKPTASGERYNQHGFSAAHPVLPLGTWILVENQENGRKIRLRVNDRGPYKKGRILDLSRSAARILGVLEKGTAPVRITVLKWPSNLDASLGMKAYQQYVVQVGAFPELKEARKRKSDLQARYQQMIFLIDPTSSGKFSVVAGPYDEAAAARNTAQRLKLDGIPTLVRNFRK